MNKYEREKLLDKIRDLYKIEDHGKVCDKCFGCYSCDYNKAIDDVLEIFRKLK